MAKASSGGSDVLVKIGGDLSDFQSSLSGVLGDVAAWVGSLNPVLAGVVAGVAAIGTAAVDIAAQYEEATNIIRTGTGATGEALEALRGDFEAVFLSVPESASEVATAIADLNTRLGLTGEPLQELTNQFLDLASVTGVDVADAIRLGTRVFGDWGVEASKQGDTLDFLFKVSQSTGIGFDELAGKVVQFGAPLRQMGFGLEESAALLGKWEKEGVNAELVMGSLRIALTKFADANIEDTNAALNELAAAIQNAGSVGEANRIAVEAFGAKAGPDMAAAIREGRFEVGELLAQLEASPESISAADGATETFSEKLAVLWHNIQSILEPLGTFILTIGRDALDAVNGLWSGTGVLGEAFAAFMGWLSPLTDALSNSLAPALQFLLNVFVGLASYINDSVIVVAKALWNNALGPLATFMRDLLASAITNIMSGLNALFGVLSKIPGVSNLVEAGQKAINTAMAAAKAPTDAAKTSVQQLEAAHVKLKPALGDVVTKHQDVVTKLKSTTDGAKAAAKAAEELEDKYDDLAKYGLKAAKEAHDDFEKSMKDGQKVLENLWRTDLPEVETGLQGLVDPLAGVKSGVDALDDPLRDAYALANEVEKALNDMGVTPQAELKTLWEEADAKFILIRDSGIASASEVERAHMVALQNQVEYYRQAGIDIPPLVQAQLTTLEGKYSTHATTVSGPSGLFSQMAKNINQSITDLSTDLVKTLWEDPGSFKEKGIAALKSLGEQVTTSFITPATAALSEFLNGVIADLLGGKGFGGMIDRVKDLGDQITGVFGGGSGVQGGNNLPTGLPGAGSGGGGNTSGGGGGGGGAMGVVNMVTGIGTLISGVIGNFQNARQETTLNAIEENTRRGTLFIGDRADGGILGQAFKITELLSWGPTVKAAEEMRDWIKGGLHDRLSEISFNSYWSLVKVSELNDLFQYNLDKLGPIVNVTVMLDGEEISSNVETRIEGRVRMATA